MARSSPALTARVRVAAALVGLLVVLVAVVVAASDRTPGELSVADGVVLGVVEGVTEYLPISSTGHLKVTQELLGITGEGADEADEEAADSYVIAIQLGAILAVLGLYPGRVASVVNGLLGRDPAGLRLALALAVAFVPAGLTAFVFGDTIKDDLLATGPIVAAWIVGGLAILLLAPRFSREGRELSELTLRDALIIGVVQVLALWPGVSRSLVTILAALAVGLAVKAAVEFSFLLGLVTLGTATTYELADAGPDIVDRFGLLSPLVGIVVALVSAVIAVTWMVDYLNRRSLAIFGWYRLAIGALVGALALTSVL